MVSYQLKEIREKQVWERFVLSRKPATFLQSWNWGEVQRLMGKKIFRWGFFRKGRLVGVSLLIKEKARRGPHLVIPGGPLIDWKEEELVDFVLRKIKNLAFQESVWFIRVRPELPDEIKWREFFKKKGFRPAPMPLHAENTWVLDLTPTEEELLVGMRKSTRYLVRRSLKEGFRLEVTTNPQSGVILKRLQAETVRRHRFVGFPLEFFQAILKSFGPDGQAKMFLVSLKGEVLVAAIIIFYGETAYYYLSGSSDKSRKTPASYFLQWQIIKEAKKRGFKNYNFWGVAPENNPRHRFWGVTVFKKGFGGRQVDWLHAQDLPLSPFYWFTYWLESLRRRWRSL